MNIALKEFASIARAIPAPATAPESGTDGAGVLSFRNFALRENVIFFFSGYLSQAVINTCAETIQARLDKVEASAKVRRKLLAAFIEIAQNVVHYSSESSTPPDQDEGEFRFGTICITGSGGKFVIMGSNPILFSSEPHLRGRLESILAMNEEELRRAYRERLSADESEEQSKGGGLGFLMLARDASAPIEFQFAQDPEWGDMFRMFYLRIAI
jgi:hypothetical protein